MADAPPSAFWYDFDHAQYEKNIAVDAEITYTAWAESGQGKASGPGTHTFARLIFQWLQPRRHQWIYMLDGYYQSLSTEQELRHAVSEYMGKRSLP